MNDTVQRLYRALVDLADAAGFVAPSKADLSDATGCSRATVTRGLAELRTLGQLEIVTEGGGGRMSTVYRIPGLSTGGSETAQETAQLSDLDVPARDFPPPPPLRGGGGGGGSLAPSRNEPPETAQPDDDDWPDSPINHTAGHPQLPPIKASSDHPQCVNPRCHAPRLRDEPTCPWCGVPYPTTLRVVT